MRACCFLLDQSSRIPRLTSLSSKLGGIYTLQFRAGKQGELVQGGLMALLDERDRRDQLFSFQCFITTLKLLAKQPYLHFITEDSWIIAILIFGITHWHTRLFLLLNGTEMSIYFSL